MKRSLKELKERQKKKRQSNLENSNNRLTSYGFSSKRINTIKSYTQETIPVENTHSSLKPPFPLKKSQSLTVIPNKKIRTEDENTINTLISGHIKKNAFISSFKPSLKRTRSYNETPTKRVITNPFQDLSADNTIIKDPFSLLKKISNIEIEESEKDKNNEKPQNELSKLSSNIFNIDYLNTESKQFTEPPTNNNTTSNVENENHEKIKESFEKLIDKEELHNYNTRHFIENDDDDDDDISESDKESIASDTDIRDIVIHHENDDIEEKKEEEENNISDQMIVETSNNSSNNQQKNSSRLLLDTLQHNDEINMDINTANDDYILNGLKKNNNNKNTEKENKNKVLEDNNFRNQLNLKNIKQGPNIPYDYTIKKNITFYSNSTFEWYGEQTTQNESKCLQAFVKDEKLSDIYKRVQQLLYYYIYPLNQFPQTTIKTLQKVLWKAKNKELNDLINNPSINDDEKEDLLYFKK